MFRLTSQVLLKTLMLYRNGFQLGMTTVRKILRKRNSEAVKLHLTGPKSGVPLPLPAILLLTCLATHSLEIRLYLMAAHSQSKRPHLVSCSQFRLLTTELLPVGAPCILESTLTRTLQGCCLRTILLGAMVVLCILAWRHYWRCSTVPTLETKL